MLILFDILISPVFFRKYLSILSCLPLSLNLLVIAVFASVCVYSLRIRITPIWPKHQKQSQQQQNQEPPNLQQTTHKGDLLH